MKKVLEFVLGLSAIPLWIAGLLAAFVFTALENGWMYYRTVLGK